MAPEPRTLTPAEALALTTEVNEFAFHCPACKVVSEVTLVDLSAEVRFCPICGLDSTAGFDSMGVTPRGP